MKTRLVLGLAGFLAHASAVAQEPPAQVAREDLSQASLDELIGRLPRVGEEFLRHRGKDWTLLPTAQEFKERIERGAELTTEQWKRVLLETGVLRFRERWPETQPFAVSMRSPGWLEITRISLTPKEKDLVPAAVGRLFFETCGAATIWGYQSALYQELGSLSQGRHRLAFDATIERGYDIPLRERLRTGAPNQHPRARSPAGSLFLGELAFDIEVVASLDEALPPVTTPAIDAAVRGSLSLAFADGADGRTAFIVADASITEHPELTHLGLSLCIDLLEGGDVRETVQLHPITHAPLVDVEEDHAFWPLASLPLSLEHDPADWKDWGVRVHGASDQILTLWSAQTRWAGTLEIPLAELVERERIRNPEGRSPYAPHPRGMR